MAFLEQVGLISYVKQSCQICRFLTYIVLEFFFIPAVNFMKLAPFSTKIKQRLVSVSSSKSFSW